MRAKQSANEKRISKKRDKQTKIMTLRQTYRVSERRIDRKMRTKRKFFNTEDVVVDLKAKI